MIISKDKTNIEIANLKGVTVEKNPDSLLFIAKKQLYVPENKIILVNHAVDRENKFTKLN